MAGYCPDFINKNSSKTLPNLAAYLKYMHQKQKHPRGLSNPSKKPQSLPAKIGKIRQYEAQSIKDVKIMKGRRFYLIKWKGYSDHQNTWEPIQNLSNLAADILLFERVHQDRIKQLQKEWNKLYRTNRVEEPLNIKEVDALNRKEQLQSDEESDIFEVKTKKIKKKTRNQKKKEKQVCRKKEGEGKRIEKENRTVIRWIPQEKDKVLVTRTMAQSQGLIRLPQQKQQSQEDILNIQNRSHIQQQLAPRQIMEQPNNQQQEQVAPKQQLQQSKQKQKQNDEKPIPFQFEVRQIPQAHDIIDDQSIDHYSPEIVGQIKKNTIEMSDIFNKQNKPSLIEMKKDKNLMTEKYQHAQTPKEPIIPQRHQELNTPLKQFYQPKDTKRVQRPSLDNPSKLSFVHSNNHLIERSITKYTYRTKRKPILKPEDNKQILDIKQAQKGIFQLVDMQLINLTNTQPQPQQANSLNHSVVNQKQPDYQNRLGQNIGMFAKKSEANVGSEKEDLLPPVDSSQISASINHNLPVVNKKSAHQQKSIQNHEQIQPTSLQPQDKRSSIGSDSPIAQLRGSRCLRIVEDQQSSEQEHVQTSKRQLNKSRIIEKDYQTRQNFMYANTSRKFKYQRSHYSSSSALFQELQTENILRQIISLHELMLGKPILYRVLRSFKLQGSIIFGVQVAVAGKLYQRFIPYSLMRDQYPRQLLLYLEEEQRLKLDNE